MLEGQVPNTKMKVRPVSLLDLPYELFELIYLLCDDQSKCRLSFVNRYTHSCFILTIILFYFKQQLSLDFDVMAENRLALKSGVWRVYEIKLFDVACQVKQVNRQIQQADEEYFCLHQEMDDLVGGGEANRSIRQGSRRVGQVLLPFIPSLQAQSISLGLMFQQERACVIRERMRALRDHLQLLRQERTQLYASIMLLLPS